MVGAPTPPPQQDEEFRTHVHYQLPPQTLTPALPIFGANSDVLAIFSTSPGLTNLEITIDSIGATPAAREGSSFTPPIVRNPITDSDETCPLGHNLFADIAGANSSDIRISLGNLSNQTISVVFEDVGLVCEQ